MLDFSNNRNIIARFFYGYCLLWITVRGLSHAWPPQLCHPELTKVAYDPVFWLFKLSGFAKTMTDWQGWLFISLLYLCFLLLILFPTKYLLSILATFLLFILDVTTNIYVTHSMHYLGAIVVISCAFWGKSTTTFSLFWNGVRYYACWIYGSAFLWKLFLGAFSQWDSGILSFKANLATYLFLNPNTGKAHLYYWFLQHGYLLNLGEKMVFLIEGLFLIGFFTRKWDKFLIISAVFIFLSTYFFSDVFFVEQLVILLPFVSVTTWNRLLSKPFPKIPD